ncbi:MAG: glycosyltransferase family 9 protein [Candidatus Margulisiibacteriota bacterium]
MKILIVKLGAIGDVLRTTSLLPGLQAKYAPVEIDWLTSRSGQEILLHNRAIRKVFTWEEKEPLGSYNLVIGLEDDIEACRLVSDLRSSQKVGAYYEGGQITYTPSTWFDMSIISRFGLDQANKIKKQNTKTYQQHMAELLGIKVSPYLFQLTPEEIEYGRDVVRGMGYGAKEKIVGINTGAGKRWQQKSWGVEQTIELVKRVKNELGFASLILGGKDERERNKTISRETGMPEAGAHSLRQFASIINRCRVVVSSDSLAMHFALALKKRVVVFFGPTSAAEIELYGLGSKVVPDLDCLVCYKKSCDLHHNCMNSLSAEKMFAALKKELA